MSPEEVYTCMRVSGDSSIPPCRWLKAELPLLLDHIKMLVASSSLQMLAENTVSMLLPPDRACLCVPLTVMVSGVSVSDAPPSNTEQVM